MNIQHSSRTDLWYTPVDILERVRRVLGDIDFDPASDIFGNSRVKARAFLSTEGVNTDLWPHQGSVFINPPGGKTGRHSNSVAFWEALMDYRRQGRLTHAVFLSFSIEHLQTTQGRSCLPMLWFPLCYPKKRVRFDSAGPTLKTSPSHSNVIAYVPGTRNYTGAFHSVFGELGGVVTPSRWMEESV